MPLNNSEITMGQNSKSRQQEIIKCIKVLITEVFNYGNNFQMQHGHCTLRRSSNKVSKVLNYKVIVLMVTSDYML